MAAYEGSDVTTIDALLALPDDGLRHELLDGVHVVTPAPSLSHQHILRELFRQLDTGLRGAPGFEVYWSPADVELGPRTLVQPDLFVIEVDPDNPPRSWKEIGVPVLAVEVLSPGTASRNRGAKREIYQRAGVAEYWIVDPDARLIERWRPEEVGPEVVRGTLERRPLDDLVQVEVAHLSLGGRRETRGAEGGHRGPSVGYRTFRARPPLPVGERG